MTGVQTCALPIWLAVARASEGEQVPAVSSSLSEDVHLAAAENTGG